MKLDKPHYIPCLRWKLGEYQALYRLSSSAKTLIAPLIEVAEIGFDFEAGKVSRSIDEHLNTFAKRVRIKWGENKCFVDMRLIDLEQRMTDGRHPMVFAFDDLRLKGVPAIPVIRHDPDPYLLATVAKIISYDKRGLCVRIGIEDVAKRDLRSSIDSLLNVCGVDFDSCDLVIDLGAPNFEPIDEFTSIVKCIISQLPYLNLWRSFCLIGTSFPSSMSQVGLGSSIIPRNEWRLYKKLVLDLRESGMRIPKFGDYVINHPQVLSLDMRLVKPFASLRYTIADSWLIVRGKNVRDHGLGQYKDLCRTAIESKHYSGREYSNGDKYIFDCAQGTEGTGNLSTWRWVGTNHHIELVVQDIASFAATSSAL